VADDVKVEVLERITDGIAIYTVLLDDRVHVITRDKKLVLRFIKKSKDQGGE
jgi:hypothetical protein